jgi:hypothetical protein
MTFQPHEAEPVTAIECVAPPRRDLRAAIGADRAGIRGSLGYCSSRSASLPHIWASPSQYVWSSGLAADAALSRHRSIMVWKYVEESRKIPRLAAARINLAPTRTTQPTSGVEQPKRIACQFAISCGSLEVMQERGLYYKRYSSIASARSSVAGTRTAAASHIRTRSSRRPVRHCR